MSAEYPGFPAVAKQYWRDYALATLGFAISLVFTGAVGALAIVTLLPAATGFFVLAAVSLVLHWGALFIRDVYSGEYEPNQTTFSSTTALFATIVIIGVFETVLLLIASVGGYAVSELLGGPALVAGAVAAYYPVSDIVLATRGWKTPGKIAAIATFLVVNTVLNIHRSVVDVIPIFGTRRRPQS